MNLGAECRKGTLTNEVNIVDGSRHDQLIKRMEQGPVIGIYFPNPLQGFSVSADREQMSTLPEGFILSGLDTVIAVMMYPDILARDWDTPGLELAALSWTFLHHPLHFKNFYSFVFGHSYYFWVQIAYPAYSGGLLFL